MTIEIILAKLKITTHYYEGLDNSGLSLSFFTIFRHNVSIIKAQLLHMLEV